MTTHDVKDRKATLRAQLRQVRGELDAGQRQRFDASIRERLLALPQVQAAAVIFMFISHGSEVDTHQSLQELHQAGKRIAVPRIMDQETMIAVPFDSWASLQPEQLGILTPQAREPMATPIDICITPGLGFSHTGRRLGYGRGYYDRWFRAHPPLFKVALAYECQILEDLPGDEYDVPVDMIVTEMRVIRIP